MNRTKDHRIDLLSTSPADPDAADTAAVSSPPSAAASPDSPALTTPPTFDIGFPDEIIETAPESFDLAIQEAIRASTPKRRDLKLIRTQSDYKRPGKKHEGTMRPPRPTPPPWTFEEILTWADAYYEQHGRWPNRYSGPSSGTQGKTWNAIDLSLYRSRRGLPGNMTLPRLLTTYRGARYCRATENGEFAPLYIPQPEHDPEIFTIPQILARADAWHFQHGSWPNADAGLFMEGSQITWCAIDSALRIGSYSLPGGSSLARLLAAERGVRNKRELPSLTQAQILEWADLHKERTGQWPTNASGAILEAPGETWAAADAALHSGGRGLRGGSSLAVLLEEERGRRNCKRTPPLTEQQILEWADRHHARTGDWPRNDTGPVFDAPEETWGAITMALALGIRSLPGGSSLASLLAEHRGKRNRKRLPHLNNAQILQWADAYKERHGDWPKHDSGPIAGTQGETWTAVAVALYAGRRGMPGGTTLPRLLTEHRAAPYQGDREPLSIDQILTWADAWHLRHDTWPCVNSGPVFEGADTAWTAVQSALAKGTRGLPGGSSLPRLLDAHRGVRNRLVLPTFTREQILEWADRHKERTNRWPTNASGAILEAPSTKWSIVDDALRHGRGGLPGGSSLSMLLAEDRGRRDNTRTPPLAESQILQWADAYHAQTGKWPTHKSGPIAGEPHETWSKVNNALTVGGRGLSRSSLAKLLLAHRDVRR
ncbi:MAG: hypothetical protein JWL77_3752 [Chthonomonadaceae bacterium]|nr:hypothetical protein [Chthonomonadaceae bacterium]